jgi:hypothetical protein
MGQLDDVARAIAECPKSWGSTHRAAHATVTLMRWIALLA